MKRTIASPLALAALLAASAPGRAAADELSAKTENYVFAASEALGDGEPALALSLLKRARAEDPQACILEEYFCRTYVALGAADEAQRAFAAFTACMNPADEPVRRELAVLVARARASVVVEPRPAPPVTSAPAPTPAPPPPTTPTPRRGAHPGAVLAWVGGGVGLAGGATATATFLAGQGWLDRGERESYETWAPVNHVAVIVGGGGGLVAAGGLLWVLLDRDRPSAATTWVPIPGGSLLTTTWIF